MDNPNCIQVDGDHYKSSEYQHWDMLARIGFGWEYYVGCATKYLTRWHKKAGVNDVRKAHHFVSKLQHLVRNGHLPQKFTTTNRNRMSLDGGPVNSRTVSVDDDLVSYFAKNGVTDETTKQAISRLVSARDLPDLEFAKLTIELLLSNLEPKPAEPQATVDPVAEPPAADSEATTKYVDQ